MPQAHEALSRLELELARSRKDSEPFLKLIHGYGSTGAGGDIRIAVQRRLHELVLAGQIKACIFGEDWRKSHDFTWRLLKQHPALKGDAELGRNNRGITVVVL